MIKTINFNLLISFFNNIIQALVSVLLTPMLIKYYGIDSFGLISILSYLQTIFFLFDAGFSNALNLQIAKLRGQNEVDKISNLLSLFHRIFFLLAISIFLLTLFSTLIFNSDFISSKSINTENVKLSIFLTGLILAFRFYGVFQRTIMLGFEKHFSLCISLIGINCTKFILFYLLLKYNIIGATVTSYFYIIFFIQITEVLILLYLNKEIYSLKIYFNNFYNDIKKYKNIFKTSLQFLTISLCTILISYSDKYFLAAVLPLKDFGYYSVAMTVSSFFLFVSSPFNTISQPLFSKTHEQGDYITLSKHFKYLSQFNLFVLLAAVFVLLINKDIIFYTWLKDTSTSIKVIEIVKFWLIGTFMSSFSQIINMFLIVKGYLKIINKINVYLSIFTCLMYIISIKLFKVEGAIFTWIFYNTLSLLFFLYLLSKTTRFHYFKELIIDYFKLGLFFIFVSIIINYIDLNPQIKFLLTIILVITYFTFLYKKEWKNYHL